MAGMIGARRYGALGHYSKEWGHGKVEKLTVSQTEVVATPRRAPGVWVDGGGKLEREQGAGEGESERYNTKLKK